MTLDTFLEITAMRIPTVPEMVELCDALDIKFAIKDGKPVLRPCPECRDEANVLAMMFRREPFRSAVIAAKLSDEIPPKPSNEIDEAERPSGPEVPVGATIVVADERGYTDDAIRGEPYMWCWLGGTTWYYVKDHPVPLTLKDAKR